VFTFLRGARASRSRLVYEGKIPLSCEFQELTPLSPAQAGFASPGRGLMEIEN
jgi:hypothetical protein